MVQQTIQFETVSLRQIGSGTITAEIYSGSTLAATLASITEDATRDGRYTGTVEDKAADTYDLQVQFDGFTVSEPDEKVTLLLAVGTYVSKRLAELDSSTSQKIDDILEGTNTTLPGLIEAIEGVNVLPAVGISADRSPGVTLNAFVGETITQSITLYETDGTTPIVLTGKTLAIVFETRLGVDVAVVSSGDITISGASDNVVTFAYPEAATSAQRTLKFAIRDAAAPLTVYLQGLLIVDRAPSVDPTP
jgi:hypothetical protein